MTGILGGLLGSLVGKRDLIWSKKDLPDSYYYTAGVYAGGINGGTYFVFGGGTTAVSAENKYYYSTDGISWTLGTLPLTIGITGAAYDGTNLVIVAGGNSTDDAYTTTNGTTWTVRDTGTQGTSGAEGHTDLIWDGTRFLATADVGSSNNLRFSTTGATWSEITAGGNSNAAGIAYDGSSRYIVLLITTTATHRTTTSDPTVAANWNNITLPSSAAWSQIIYGNGIWLAMRPGVTGYATSTDGTTWTARTLPTTFGSSAGLDFWNNRTKVVFYKDNFYYNSTDRTVYKSSDGINWTVVYNHSATSNLYGIAAWAAGPKLVGAGYWRITGTQISENDYILGE